MLNWRNTKPIKLEDETSRVFELVINKTYEMGFEHCCFMTFPQLTNNQTEPIEFSNYPNEWTSTYKKAHFFHTDPVVAHCRRNVFPVVWKEEVFSSEPNLWDLAQSFGVDVALTQSVHDFQGVCSMLTLGRSKGAVTPEELYEKAGQVLWLCHAMHAVVAQSFADTPSIKPSCKLTCREIEILRWSAMGKTAEEVGKIMSITPRTVVFHLAGASRKLGVNSKIAAVLRASKEGLFD
ncbi:LuxR family transcriptional regulator [Pseudomonas sp. B22129]|uniref:LuxR family transcriptional regulator n=1 Tax=Pseudomonas sp. B22129 TaxID=3235111 RepID=UPI003784C4BD